MDTKEAVQLRKQLELDILALLQKYRDLTGMTPTSVDVQVSDMTVMGAGTERSMALTGVRVQVQI